MKQWWKSKTLWVNMFVVVLAVIEANTGLLQPFIPADIYLLIAIGLPVINAFLRVITTQKLTA